MSTYKILKNVLDFLEEKNELRNLGKLPEDQSIEVRRGVMEWNKVYPKVETPDNGEKEKSLMEKTTRDIVKVQIDKYFDGDRNTWHRYIEVETRAKNKDEDCTIIIRWNNFFHPQVLRAKWLLLKMDKDNSAAQMLKVDKNMALIDPSRIDKILQGEDSGKKEVHKGET